jgi:hypothetical protein
MFSIYKPNSNSASFGRYLEGDEHRVCYDTETEFPVELARVKAETLSGAIGLAALTSGKARTLSQACFSLIP